MAILDVQKLQVGTVGVNPNIVFIQTNDTIATVLTAGYLNHAMANGAGLNESSMCLVATKTTPNAVSTEVSWFEVSYNTSTLNWSLVQSGTPGAVVLPTIANHIATYTNTTGTLSESASTAINSGNIQAGLSGTAGYLASFPSAGSKGSLRLTAVANTGDTLVTVSNALHGQATVYSIPDSGATTANFILSKTTGTQHITVGGLQVDAGVVTSGISTGGFVGSFAAFPTTASKGSLRLTALVNATGDFYTEISNALAVGQSQVITVPDSGAATASFILTSGTAATATITKISTGATPVPMVDPGSCTISAAAGASNVATVTIQLKDGAGVNIARSVKFTVYSSSAADGLTLQSAASTGYSVASGGLSLNNGAAITTQITAMSSATGGCVLSLTDTGKQTSYLVLSLSTGNKISAQLSAGSYGA